MKILSHLIKTGLGLKLIFGDFSFRDLFSSEDYSYGNREYPDMFEFYKYGRRDMSKFAYKLSKFKKELDTDKWETVFENGKLTKSFKYNLYDF